MKGCVLICAVVVTVIVVVVKGQEECRRLDPTSLEKYVTKLEKPVVKEPNRTISVDGEEVPLYVVVLRAGEVQVHPQLPPTYMYLYDGDIPGPTFEAESGKPVAVSWVNLLPDKHFLPVDTTLLYPDELLSSVYSVTHLHGAHAQPQWDGHPQDWVTHGQEYFAYYKNDQPGSLLWYHDHSHGITRLNVFAGLAGPYVLRDQHERQLGLPEEEHVLLISDRSFCEDGSLYYPAQPDDATPEMPYPSVIAEYFGDVITVNGRVWPNLEVGAGPIRVRLLAATNARTLILSLRAPGKGSGPDGLGEVVPFTVIGTEGGFLEEAVQEDHLLMMSAQRFDILVDLTDFAGEELFLRNFGPDSPWKGSIGDAKPADPGTTGQVLRLTVASAPPEPDLHARSVPNIAADIPALPRLPDYCNEVDEAYTIGLYENEDEWGRLLLQINNRSYEDPVDIKITLDATVAFDFVNYSPDSHPMHIHLVQYRVCGIANSTEPTAEDFMPPPPLERGLRDVVQVPPYSTVRVAAPFDIAGEFLMHCHLIEHEDYSMMRPFRVAPAGQEDVVQYVPRHKRG
mmetsp:Transcript_20140/g.56648  ORF Transcript_20140/g.56648 Transcript_20140/m.56648 type:complete len:567 (-) Transcript_20140:12-1712(-)